MSEFHRQCTNFHQSAIDSRLSCTTFELFDVEEHHILDI